MKTKIPRLKKGYTLTVHLAQDQFELVTFPATNTKPERKKWCHKVLGYSMKKTPKKKPWENKTEEELIVEIRKELKNATK